MEPTNDVAVLSSAELRWSKAIMCALAALLLVLLLVDMAKHTNTIVFVYMGIVSLGVVIALVGTARAFRAGIYLFGDRVVVQSTFSRVSWRWTELERAETIDRISRGGPLGVLAMTSQRAEPRVQIIAVFRRVQGSPVVVRALRVSTSSPHEENWLDDALHEVNRRIDAHRGFSAT